MTASESGARLPADFRDLLLEFVSAGVEFLVIGGHAVAHHGFVRATLDMDVLVRPTVENGARVVAALERFGAPLAAHGVTADDFARPGSVYQIGIPPVRIDILTSIAGVTFDEAWGTRSDGLVEGRTVAYIGREALIRNKRAAGRPKDLCDVDELS